VLRRVDVDVVALGDIEQHLQALARVRNAPALREGRRIAPRQPMEPQGPLVARQEAQEGHFHRRPRLKHDRPMSRQRSADRLAAELARAALEVQVPVVVDRQGLEERSVGFQCALAEGAAGLERRAGVLGGRDGRQRA